MSDSWGTSRMYYIFNLPSRRQVKMTVPDGLTKEDFRVLKDEVINIGIQAAKRPEARPRRVCLCGSTRFHQAFQTANYDMTMRGYIVLTVGFYPHSSMLAHGETVGCSDEQKKRLDELHLRKIDLADEILVLNVKAIVCRQCGKPSKLYTETSNETECCRTKLWSLRPYIGDSTRREIAYAVAAGKPVHYLNDPEE